MTPPGFPDDWPCPIDRIVAKYEPYGRVTIGELNEDLPVHEFTSDLIELVFGALSECGIEVVKE
jgi:Sigma-70 factor, region 1.1